jgi:hypothetical protein
MANPIENKTPIFIDRLAKTYMSLPNIEPSNTVNTCGVTFPDKCNPQTLHDAIKTGYNQYKKYCLKKGPTTGQKTIGLVSPLCFAIQIVALDLCKSTYDKHQVYREWFMAVLRKAVFCEFGAKTKHYILLPFQPFDLKVPLDNFLWNCFILLLDAKKQYSDQVILYPKEWDYQLLNQTAFTPSFQLLPSSKTNNIDLKNIKPLTTDNQHRRRTIIMIDFIDPEIGDDIFSKLLNIKNKTFGVLPFSPQAILRDWCLAQEKKVTHDKRCNDPFVYWLRKLHLYLSSLNNPLISADDNILLVQNSPALLYQTLVTRNTNGQRVTNIRYKTLFANLSQQLSDDYFKLMDVVKWPNVNLKTILVVPHKISMKQMSKQHDLWTRLLLHTKYHETFSFSSHHDILLHSSECHENNFLDKLLALLVNKS